MMQYAAHFFAPNNAGAAEQSKLINSPAAQELLWGHVATAEQKEVVNRNPLRLKMIEELTAMGWFPKGPRKLGVANGRGNGVGNGVPMGAINIQYKADCHAGTMLTSPLFSKELQDIGALWKCDAGNPAYKQRSVPSFDGAPGGTSTFYEWVAKAVGVVPKYGTTCFVPTVSALSIDRDWYADVSKLRPGVSNFDDYTWDPKENGGHVRITSELATWILDRLPRLAGEIEAIPAEAALATVE